MAGVKDGLCVLSNGGADELALRVDYHQGFDSFVGPDAVDALVDLRLE